jgi:starch phosphorylase
MVIKFDNEIALAVYILGELNIGINLNAFFNPQIKCLNRYKRWHFNFSHILALFRCVANNLNDDSIHPRVPIFRAKTTSGSIMAENIIHVINLVAEFIKNSQEINGKIQVAFIPNYRVTVAEQSFPERIYWNKYPQPARKFPERGI